MPYVDWTNPLIWLACLLTLLFIVSIGFIVSGMRDRLRSLGPPEYRQQKYDEFKQRHPDWEEMSDDTLAGRLLGFFYAPREIHTLRIVYESDPFWPLGEPDWEWPR
jgi:hypothetical protein